MVERIEKVARVKGVEYDENRAFQRKEGYGGSAGKKFSQVLKEKLGKKGASQEGTIPAAYRLELSTRPTQSLFYQGGLDLHGLGARIRGQG